MWGTRGDQSTVLDSREGSGGMWGAFGTRCACPKHFLVFCVTLQVVWPHDPYRSQPLNALVGCRSEVDAQYRANTRAPTATMRFVTRGVRNQPSLRTIVDAHCYSTPLAHRSCRAWPNEIHWACCTYGVMPHQEVYIRYVSATPVSRLLPSLRASAHDNPFYLVGLLQLHRPMGPHIMQAPIKCRYLGAAHVSVLKFHTKRICRQRSRACVLTG